MKREKREKSVTRTPIRKNTGRFVLHFLSDSLGTPMALLSAVPPERVVHFVVGGRHFFASLDTLTWCDGSKITTEAIGNLTLSTPSGARIPLSQVARVVDGIGPAAIEHVGRERSVMVYATTLPGASTAQLIQTLDRTAASLDMPPGYSTALTGQAREFGKAARGFAIAIILSFVFMYLIIAAQFESWIYPLSILASLPLTVPFALVSVLIFGQSLNVYSMLGLLVLFGIVKKNSILQVDHTLTLLREGFSRPDAIMLANRDRLRPILMTTIAFVAGMVPLLLSKGAGAGTNHAIAGIVLGKDCFCISAARCTSRSNAFFDSASR